ncbi:hypothetical protein [Marinicellulosiphila megalodicopiae]|uniref:hypothetical protein n=1 Tax=Marinicellulosiphila megalodicopiae TaxID=2724896 RepID=UPI003BB1B9E9
MNNSFRLLSVAFLFLSSCQVTVGGDDTDSITDTSTETAINNDVEVNPANSTILANPVTNASYSLEITEQNYQYLYSEYDIMFSDKYVIYTDIISDGPDFETTDVVNGVEIVTQTYNCSASGSLHITTEYDDVNGSNISISEQIHTDQCEYYDDNIARSFDYESQSINGIISENFNYENSNDEFVIVDSAYSAQGEQSILEVFVNHESYGRFFIRAINEFKIDETISIYGDDFSSVALLNKTIQKDSLEPCYYRNIEHYSFDENPSIEVQADLVDLCVSNFDKSLDFNYQQTQDFDYDLSVISYTLTIVSDNTPVRSVFTLENDEDLLELTVVHNDEVIFYDVANIIESPFNVLDSGNYHFYFRNINVTGQASTLFYQLKTEQSFFDYYAQNSNDGPSFESEHTAVWLDDSGEEKDAPGNIRKPIIVNTSATYFFRMTTENEIFVYLSDADEQVMIDNYDVFRVNDTQYYLSIDLEPGTYYLDIGATDATNDSRIIIEIDKYIN